MIRLPKEETLYLRMTTRSIYKKTKFKFHVIDELQLGRVFGKLKTSKGSDIDGIASCFLKMALPVTSESLCDIFNLSIATGCFPDSWRIARVVPTFKSGQPDDRSNYRPISIYAPCFSQSL